MTSRPATRCRAVLFAACLLLAALAAGDAGPPSVTLRLWNVFPPEAVRDVNARIHRRVFEAFLEAHPEVHVESASGITMSGEQAESARLLALAAGIGADVLILSTSQVQSYVEQNLLLPLDEFLPEWQPYHDFDDQVWSATRRDDSTYAVPAGYVCPEVSGFGGFIRVVSPTDASSALVYRRDVFAEAGLDPDRPPETWEELLAFARRLTDSDVLIRYGPRRGQRVRRYGFGFIIGAEGGMQFTNFVWQAGGEMVRLTEDGWRAAFDEPEGVAALEFLRRMRWEPFERNGKRFTGVMYIAPRQDLEAMAQAQGSVTNKFASGEVAMIIDSPDNWRLSDENPWGLNSRSIGVAPLPAGPGGRASVFGTTVYAISSQASDPAVRRAAWDYIQFMNGRAAARALTEARIQEYEYLHAAPRDLEEFGYEEFVREIPEAFVEIADAMRPHQRLEPYLPGYQHISRVELATPLYNVLVRSPHADPANELREAALRADLLLRQGAAEEPETGGARRALAAALAIGTVAAGALILCALRRLTGVSTGGDAPRRGRLGEHAGAWLLLLPAVLSMLVWAYFPMLRGLFISFQDYRLIGEGRFVGLQNFVNVLAQPLFWEVLRNTFLYVGLTLSMGFIIPLVLALLLSEVPRGKYFFRTVYYLPAVVSPIVALLLWRGMIYDPSPNGILNQLLGAAGREPQRWLGDPGLAMACVVVATVWAGAGPASLIYIAAMKCVPDQAYEAADLDGAGVLRKVWHVTFPYLRPLIVINLIGAFVGAFQAAETILVMTQGGPANATRTIALEIFYNAFLYLRFGYATAMAWIMGAMLMGFTLWNLRILRKVEFRRATGAR